MKITTLFAVALLSGGTASAQCNQSRRGGGCKGTPQTDGERTARQEECQKSNAGNCDGQGQGNGKGNGHRRGQRDGSGPLGGAVNRQAGA